MHSTSFCHKFVGILNKGAFYIFYDNFLSNVEPTMLETSFAEKRITVGNKSLRPPAVFSLFSVNAVVAFSIYIGYYQ